MVHHGTLNYSLEDGLLIIEGTGPWNQNALKPNKTGQAVLESVRNLPFWGVLAILDGDPIHTPDAARLLTDYVRRDKLRGRIGSALVLSSSTAPEFGRLHIADIYRKAGEKFEFFNDISEAKRWLFTLLNAAKTAVQKQESSASL